MATKVKIIISKHSSAKKIIETCIKEKKDCSFEDNGKNSMFAIFDVDQNPNECNFDKLIKDAEQKNIKIILSNPCFELWLLLHYKQYNRSCTNEDLIEELSHAMNMRYDKRYDNCSCLNEKMRQTAIVNSKSMCKCGETAKDCSQNNPRTNAHIITEYLEEQIE